MSTSVANSLIAADTDKVLVLNNSQVSAPLDGITWNSIRIGIRMSMDDTADSPAAHMYLGMHSNPAENMTNGPMGSSCSHFVGFIANRATYSRQTGSGTITYYTAGTNEMCKKIGNTTTLGTGYSLASNITGAPSLRWSAFFLDIVKGSPNYTITGMSCAGTAYTQTVSQHDFETVIRLSDLATADAWLSDLTGAPWGTDVATLAVDEVDGILNSVCVGWDYASNFYVSDLDFCVLS